MSSPLYLDHFYCGVSEEVFDELKALEQFLPITLVKEVLTDSDSWRGIYTFSTSNCYSELLLRADKRASRGLGFAFSGLGAEKNLSAQLQSQFQSIQWEQNMLRTPEGASWFESISPKKDVSLNHSIVAWAMEYQGDFRDKRLQRAHLPGIAIRTFDRVHVRVPSQELALLENRCEWYPGTKRFEQNAATIQFPLMSHGQTAFYLEADSNLTLPALHKIEVTLESNATCANTSGKFFGLEISGQKVTLSFL
jgi:hypothetical protein